MYQATIRGTAGSWLAAAALAGCVVVLGGGSAARASVPVAPGTPPSGFKVLTSSAGGYRIAYPASWHAAGASLTAVFRGPVVRGIPISVYVYPLGSASAYTSVDAFASVLAHTYRKKGLTVVTKIRIAATDARIFSWQSVSSSTPERNTMGAFLSHGRAWTITYSAAVSAYTRWSGAFHTMLSTFTFVR